MSMYLRHEPIDAGSSGAPIRVLEVEVTRPVPFVSPSHIGASSVYSRVLIAVRLHSQPIGLVELDLGSRGITPEELSMEIWRRLGSQIVAHLQEDGLPPIAALDPAGMGISGIPRCLRDQQNLLTSAPSATVVVATRDRPESLIRCLQSLDRIDYPQLEIIVVDNDPTAGNTMDSIWDSVGSVRNLRCVRESRPGLSWARNCGLELAQGEIIAFTDDDALVDRHWLAGMVRGFAAAENVACVTGLTLPAELDTAAQVWFERFGGFGRGFSRRVFDLGNNRPPDPLYPFRGSIFGSGVNMAFHTSILRRVGGFDPALGAGSLALSGEDFDAWFRILREGYQIVYEPSAIVHHSHRKDYGALRRQIYGYGVGTTATPTKFLIDNPELVFDMVGRVPHVLIMCARLLKKARRGPAITYPSELMRAVIIGMVYGPIAYLRGRSVAKARSRLHAQPKSGISV